MTLVSRHRKTEQEGMQSLTHPPAVHLPHSLPAFVLLCFTLNVSESRVGCFFCFVQCVAAIAQRKAATGLWGRLLHQTPTPPGTSATKDAKTQVCKPKDPPGLPFMQLLRSNPRFLPIPLFFAQTSFGSSPTLDKIS